MKTDLDPDVDQERAIDLICSDHRCVIITGGPGTGKTTILKSALRDARIFNKDVALAAPTGKAAKRMESVIGRPAKTVHRLVGWDGESFSAGQYLTEDIIFVDEASMLDVEMAYYLMRSLTQRTRLILIGDVDQIPSVGPGSVLRDLIDSQAVPVVALKTLHRAAKESWICTNAQKIIQGEEPDYETREDFEAFELTGMNDIIDKVITLLDDNRQAFYEGRFQFLTPQRVGDLGADVLNHLVAEHMNSKRKTETDCFEVADSRNTMQHTIYVEDRVIHVQNNYQLKVFNGEIGTVMSIKGGRVVVQYPERLVTYTQAQAQFELRLAYVLTVHKAQGSEWDTVAVLCHGSHSRMWNRQLLYTAVTRAKKKVYLIANAEGVGTALRCNNPRERFTTLPARIKEWGKNALSST